MQIVNGFEEPIYLEIARASGNKQIIDDVKYMRTIQFRSARYIVAERLENAAFFIGYHNSDHFRLVGIACRKEYSGKGYGRLMLKRAIDYSIKNGFKKIKTRTSNGVDFYQRFGGFKIVGMRGDDFYMEKDL